MDLTQLANLGEFIGGVAVLVTLVYLAVQVRRDHEKATILVQQIQQDANAATLQATNAWLTDYNRLAIELARDPDFSLLYRRGLRDFEALTGNDQMRFHGWMVAHTLNAQTLFFELEESSMQRDIAAAVLGFNAALLGTPGGGRWWETGRTIWRPEFITQMDQLIQESEPIDRVWPWFVADPEEMPSL